MEMLKTRTITEVKHCAKCLVLLFLIQVFFSTQTLLGILDLLVYKSSVSE